MTDQLAQAKKWMSRAAKAAALTILPLAAATAAQAGVVLFGGSGGGCFTSGSAACTASGLADNGSGNSGIRFSLNEPYFGQSLYISGGTGQIFGSLEPGSLIPYSWSADISGFEGAFGSLSIYLYNSGNAPTDEFPILFSGAGPHSGSGNLVVSSGLTQGNYLQISFGAALQPFPFNDRDAIGDIPPVTFNSFQLDFFPISEVPEPGTIAMMGGALGLLGLAVRRKHQ